jgi:hypothetical protein
MNFNMFQRDKVVKKILQVRGKLTTWNLKKINLAWEDYSLLNK